MNTLQAEQIRDLIAAIQEKGFVENVHVESIQEMRNGTVVLKIAQYFHFFPKSKEV